MPLACFVVKQTQEVWPGPLMLTKQQLAAFHWRVIIDVYGASGLKRIEDGQWLNGALFF